MKIRLALATLTASTLLKLVPPAVTKLVIDYVLPGKPLPAAIAERWHLPAAGMPLLVALGCVVLGISLVATFVNIWGRWLATVKESIRSVAPRFAARRMVKEYVQRMYAPAMDRHAVRAPENPGS